ncbi:cysteine synthase [Chloropicon primus]|uniref:cysteine synthase n=2 Tax=Chloropicon primus TaxID=1764295 RepID=A0A5B8MMS2_9CHLO|nr:cysteine synthase [Chloropicon primus]UPR01023.1 cysteine synthase [Chloropicon primus]|eukprot:QDZ21803.1 cysteine synthase [Chloropicon primus]
MKALALSASLSRQVGYVLVLGAGLAVGYWLGRSRRRATPSNACVPSSSNVVDLIGNTPLVRINSLSDATGCEILGKAEFVNPGGSIKDRVALQIVKEGLSSGELKEGGTVFEGTAGSTGVSLSLVTAALGCKCHVYLPDDAAIEKAELLQAYGASVDRVRPVSISHRDHFVNLARRKAQSTKGGFFSNQFENLANFRAHLKTGREIFEQTNGKIDAFVAAAGTGGTIAGISTYLKSKLDGVSVYLIDPPGSSLYNRVKRGVMYTNVEAEGKRLKNPFDTITEGIGINRLTRNFMEGEPLIDGAFQGTDMEAVEMSRWLVREDGLFVGSSSAMNCVGALKVARKLGPGHTIVTVLCDGGQRHLSKFHNRAYLEKMNLSPKGCESLDFVH